MKIRGYSLYVNTAYYETYESLQEAINEAGRYTTFNEVEILPMMGKGELRC